MPRDINSVIETLKDNPENMPFEIYQIYLDEETLYLACYPENVEFFDENGNPQTYYAAALSRQGVNTKTDTEVDTTQVTIDNVSRDMSSYIAHTEFVGRKIVIWKVFHEDLSDPENYVPIFEGYMDEPNISQYTMSVTVVSSLDTLNKKTPGRKFQVKCPWQFGSDECGRAIPTAKGTVDSIDGLTVYDSALSQQNNFWEFGSLTIGKETRVIESSANGSITVEYPFDKAQAGDSYTAKAGCDKTMDGPNGCQRWNNKEHYGGFLSIPKIKDIRQV